MLIVLLLALAVVAAGCAPASVSEDVAALNEKVDALTAKVDAIKVGGGAPTAALEAESQRVYGELNNLVSQGKIKEAQAQVRSIGQKYAATKIGSRFNSLGRELAIVGKDIPAKWGVEKWIQGQDAINLDNGDTTVLVFWEHWCPHCRNEVPKLQEVYNKYQSKGLQMVGMTKMSRNTGEAKIRELLDENKVTYPIAKDDGSIAAHFAVSGIPAAAVVKGGKCVWRGHPSRITDDLLNGWLNS